MQVESDLCALSTSSLLFSFFFLLTKTEHSKTNHNKNNPMTTRKMIMSGLVLSAGKDDVGQIGISFGPVIGSVAGSVIRVFVLEKFHPGSVTGSV